MARQAMGLDVVMPASQPDQWDTKAAELLPCVHDSYCGREHRAEHHDSCPAIYRPAVAAALRVAYQQGISDRTADLEQRLRDAQRALAYIAERTATAGWVDDKVNEQVALTRAARETDNE